MNRNKIIRFTGATSHLLVAIMNNFKNVSNITSQIFVFPRDSLQVRLEQNNQRVSDSTDINLHRARLQCRNKKRVVFERKGEFSA